MWPGGFFFPVVYWPVGYFPLATSPTPGQGGSSLIVACAPALGPGFGFPVICNPLPPLS